jgi:hypothetical protein
LVACADEIPVITSEKFSKKKIEAKLQDTLEVKRINTTPIRSLRQSIIRLNGALIIRSVYKYSQGESQLLRIITKITRHLNVYLPPSYRVIYANCVSRAVLGLSVYISSTLKGSCTLNGSLLALKLASQLIPSLA